MPIIAVASAKGGTGKTTAALTLAAALAELPAAGLSTLLIDLDPGGDPDTQRMGVDREGALFDAIIRGRRNPLDHMGAVTVLKVAQETVEGFGVVPSCDDIEDVEAHFADLPGGTEL